MKNRTTKKYKHKTKNFPLNAFFKVSFIYFILFMALFGMVDYYAMMAYNFIVILWTSSLLALSLGLYHVTRGRHTHVDDVADELL